MAMKVAVVTPYHREEDSVLQACLASVRSQTWKPCTHFLVADGIPNPAIAQADVKHIILPSAHGGGGNLARCLGAMTAAAEGFDAVAFLDADNWYRAEHVERLVELHLRTGASVCTSSRSIHRLDGSVMNVADASNGDDFTDTNCLCVFRAAFDLLPLWGMIPPAFGMVGDRIFWYAVRTRCASRAHSPEPTVCYRSTYARHYELLGEDPPPAAKRSHAYLEVWNQVTSLASAEKMSLVYGQAAVEDVRTPAERLDSRAGTTKFGVGMKGRKFVLDVPDGRSARRSADDIFTKDCYGHPSGGPAPKNILDIGANVGLSAAFFRLVYPDAALHCVEPDPRAYDCLSRNAALIGNCRTYQAALFNVTCPSRLYYAGNGAGASLAPISGRSGRILLLDARYFMARLPVVSFDLVKIDAAGAEVLILFRIRDMLAPTSVIHVRFYSQPDRRLIDEMLQATHRLSRETTVAPDFGRLTYVRRPPSELEGAGA
jgi:FkbM family methyltransferase